MASFNIPKSFHSSLIGRGGSVIKMIESECGVDVSIPRRDDPSRAVVVKGGAANVQAAQHKIESILGYAVSQEPLQQTSINVESREQGRLIGRGGSTLRSLEAYGVSIQVPRRGEEGELVHLEGSEDNVRKVLEQIQLLLQRDLRVSGFTTSASEVKQREPVNLSKVEANALFFPDDEQSSSFARLSHLLESARHSISVCTFTLSDNRLRDILLFQHKAGLNVRLISDNDTSQNLGSDIQYLIDAGVPVRLDKTRFHMHHKFAILDELVLLNGSYNWSKQASANNHENIVVSPNPTLIRAFQAEFEKNWNEFR